MMKGFPVKLQDLRFLVTLVFLVSLTGCQAGEVSLTLEIESTPTHSSPATPVPAAPSAEPAPSPTAEPDVQVPTLPAISERPCINQAEYVQDMSVPDGSQLEPGEPFIKIWRLRNAGSCTWNKQYAYFFAAGERMEAYEVLPMPQDVAPGDQVDLVAAMTAPSSPGTYQGDWLLRDSDGVSFGMGPEGSSPFWVRIVVPAEAASVKATPVSDTPAAGICPGVEGPLVTMTINPDMPDPRCVTVRSDQRLRIVNGRAEEIHATLFNRSADIAPGGEYTLDASFGELLMPGVHLLDVNLCCGGAIWLQVP